MKRQRGNLYVVFALVIAAGLVLTGLVLAWNKYTSELDARGYSRGVDETTAKYQKRDNAALQAALREVETLRAQVAATEQRHADQLATKEAQSAKKLAEKDSDYDAMLAAVNSGGLVWRDPGKGGSGPADSPQGGTAQAAGDTCSCPGLLGGRVVSAEAQRFLLGEAHRADRIVEKLNLCRGVLETERSP